MVQYFDDYEIACIDGHSFKRDKKTGYYLSSKPIGKRRKRLHVYVWEKYNGLIPKGYQVHHKDRDKTNNEIENLELLDIHEHMSLHNSTLTDEQKALRAERIIKTAMPAARAWHSTEEGKKWHSEHGKEVMENRPYLTYICSYCGNEFQSRHVYSKKDNTFCSNKCKSAFRRKQGVDNIVKICECCGGEYVANKYQNTKYCQDCQNRKGYPRGRVQHGS